MPTFRTQVRHDYAVTGGPGFNTFHYRTGGGADIQGDLDNAMDAIEAFYVAMRALYPPGSRLSSDGSWTDVDSSEEVVSPTWATTGNATVSTYLPPAIQVCVGWRTSSRTRSGRGRTFLGPVATNASDAVGTPTTSVLNAVQAAATALVNYDPVGFDGSFGVYSPTQNVIRDLTGTSTRDIFAVLRSRRD